MLGRGASLAWGGAFLAVACLAMLIALGVGARRGRRGEALDEAPSRLRAEIARVVERGGTMDILLGAGNLSGERAMSSVAALRLGALASDIAVSYGLAPRLLVGDATLLPVAQTMLREVYARYGVVERYDPTDVQFLAPDALAYAAAAGDSLNSERPRCVVIAGFHGAEVALAYNSALRRDKPLWAAIDSGPGSASAFPATDWFAPGEGLFSAAAAGDSPLDTASLATQDVLRWVLVAALLAATAWALLGG